LLLANLKFISVQVLRKTYFKPLSFKDIRCGSLERLSDIARSPGLLPGRVTQNVAAGREMFYFLNVF